MVGERHPDRPWAEVACLIVIRSPSSGAEPQ